MAGVNLRIIGTEQIVAKLGALGRGGILTERLGARLSRLAQALREYIASMKLHGQVLKQKSGTLAQSIHWKVEIEPGRVFAKVFVGKNAWYGRIHEYGGTFDVPAYTYIRTNFFGRVTKPTWVLVREHTATYPERSFMRSSLREWHSRAVGEIRRAVQEAFESMSALTREEVDVLVFEKLQAITGIKTCKRTLEAWSTKGPEQQPALYMADGPEAPVIEKGYPPLWTYHYLVTAYVNRQANTGKTPDTGLNAVLEKVRNLFPPSAVTGWQDLGGAVGRAYIDAPIDRFPGSLADQAVATIPVAVRMKGDNFLGGGVWWFDSGTLYAVPGTNQVGQLLTDRSPRRIGTIRNVRIRMETKTNMSAASAGLYPILAQNQLGTIGGRFDFSRFDGSLFAAAFLGQEPTAGAVLLQDADIQTVPSAGDPEVQAAVPAGGTWVSDLGVQLTETGSNLTKILVGDPAAGQFRVDAGGLFVFNAAQAGKQVQLAFRYSTVGGSRVVIANSPPYNSPEFEFVAKGEYNGRQVVATFPRCVVTAQGMESSLEGFGVGMCEFQALGNIGGSVGSLDLG